MSPFNVPITIPANVRFEGSWERSGRSLNAAAVAGLLGIGLIYTYGQTFLLWVGLIGTTIASGGAEHHQGMFDLMNDLSDYTRIPLRFSLSISQYCFMLLPTLWLVRRWHTRDVRRYIRLSPLPFRAVALAALSALFFFPTNAFLSEYFISKLNIPHELIAVGEKTFRASSGGEFLLLVFIIAVTPAICEEVLFRGYVQRTLERTVGWKSIFIVGVIFGLYHLQPLGLLSLSGLGILFGFFYYTGKSIIPGMAAHFTNNFVVLLMLYLPHVSGLPDIGAAVTSPGIALLSLPIAGVLAFGFWKVVRGGKVGEERGRHAFSGPDRE